MFQLLRGIMAGQIIINVHKEYSSDTIPLARHAIGVNKLSSGFSLQEPSTVGNIASVHAENYCGAMGLIMAKG